MIMMADEYSWYGATLQPFGKVAMVNESVAGEGISHGVTNQQNTRMMQSAESRLTVTGPLRKNGGPVRFS